MKKLILATILMLLPIAAQNRIMDYLGIGIHVPDGYRTILSQTASISDIPAADRFIFMKNGRRVISVRLIEENEMPKGLPSLPSIRKFYSGLGYHIMDSYETGNGMSVFIVYNTDTHFYMQGIKHIVGKGFIHVSMTFVSQGDIESNFDTLRKVLHYSR